MNKKIIMKISAVVSLTVLLLLIPLSRLLSQEQNNQNPVVNIGERIPLELIIDVAVSSAPAIGYAYCFNGKVLNVTRGALKDKSILITVIAGDDENLKILKSGTEETVFRISFVGNRNNEEYSTAYITGFVDSKRTSWKIVSIEIAGE
jgi:hypothetical protein